MAVFLGLLILCTLGLERTVVQRLEDTAGVRRQAAVQEAAVEVEARFDELVEAMRAQAAEIVSNPIVSRALRAAYDREDLALLIAEQEGVIQYFGGLRLAPPVSVELFTPDGRLLAWAGESFPEGAAVRVADIPRAAAISVEEGEERYRALVLWMPVREGGRFWGAVRVLRLVERHGLRESPYPPSYRLVQDWSLGTEATLRLAFGSDTTGVDDPASDGTPGTRDGAVVVLRDVDGTVLGKGLVQPPSAEAVVHAARGRFRDVVAFWTLLLAGWGFAGVWGGYRAWKRERLGRESRPRLREAAVGFAVATAALWGLRYVMLGLDVPGRWFGESFLFDPVYLASTWGEGLARSIGDLLISSFFVIFFALAFLELAAGFSFRALRGRNVAPPELLAVLRERAERPRPAVFLGGTALAAGLLAGIWSLNGYLTERVVLDSTLDYFAWTGLSPEPGVLIVFCTMILGTAASVLTGVGVVWLWAWNVARARPAWGRARLFAAWALVVTAAPAAAYAWGGFSQYAPWWSMLLFFLVAGAGALYALIRGGQHERLLVLRSILLALVVATGLLYPLLYAGMINQRSIRMVEVSEEFVGRQEAEIRILLERIADAARSHQEIGRGLLGSLTPTRAETLAESLAVRADVPFGNEYALALHLLDAEERIRAGYRSPGWPDIGLDEVFAYLRQAYARSRDTEIVFGQLSNPLDAGTVHYGILSPLGEDGRGGWILAVAAPLTVRLARQSPALSATGMDSFTDWRRTISIAEFWDGRLVRSEGQHFERILLPPEVAHVLEVQPWYERVEMVYDRPFETYYRRHDPPGHLSGTFAAGSGRVEEPVSVIAVRMRAIISYDHLYYILRVIVAGLWIGAVFYAAGLYLRWRAGLLPPPKVSFSEKIQNAFLGVGIIAVVLMGWIGQDVILRENQGAIQSRLERRLQRIEDALIRASEPGEWPYEVLRRVDIDSLASELSLDFNVYEEGIRVASSQPPDVGGLPGDRRLPIEAYDALYREGFRQAFVQIARDVLYTIGYKALVDDHARPQSVIAVLTIPEQERIREERARTTAYLFGALLLLLLVIMTTATFLASSLSRPIRRLRDGLESVAAGKFQRPIPVESHDEFGELTATFNAMQEQLAESRRKLGQQERELAWREMAKQVAHEIKNPLTPMKLSIQHLQRAYEEGERDGRFDALFRRITSTLTEQIDTLARIANEFSSFARLPKQHLEMLDLNAALREAVDLMKEETDVPIDVHFSDDPLVVRADREELRRVYINLLKNAVQAIETPEEGTVTIHTWREPVFGNGAAGHAFCSITDTGTGIPPELQEKIFQPNFSTKTSGMGLGLAIVKKSIENMHGAIGFETWEQVGTTFKIRLPLAE